MGGCQLLVLYVTVEQENAVRTLFKDRNWHLENKAYYLYEAICSKRVRAELSEETKAIKIQGEGTKTAEIYNVPVHPSNEVCKIPNQYSNSQSSEDTVDNTTCIRKTVPSKSHSQSLSKAVRAKQSLSKLKQTKGRPSRKTNLRNLSKHVEKDKDIVQTMGTDCDANDKDKDDIQFKRTRSEKIETDDQLSSLTAEKEKEEKLQNFHLNTSFESKEVFQCKFCSYNSTIRSNYLRHAREVHVSTRHHCPHCSKSFKSRHEAKLHEQHAHVRSLKCEECGKTFTSRGGLLNHNKQVHLKKALYTCAICNSTFLYKHHYQGHMNNHNADKPFLCKKCGKPFSYKASMILHEKNCKGVKYYETHNKDGSLKPVKKQKFLCDICGDTLSNKNSLKTHHKLVHTETPRSECSICKKQFKSGHSLTRHMRIIHTEDSTSFPCEICGMTFNQVTILRQHVKRHKQEFSVYCGTCGKGFYSNYKMKEHERIHTGEKPFACPVCTVFTCSSKNNLLKHMKVHENVKKTRQRKKPAGQASKEDNCAESVVNNLSSLPLTEDKTSIAKLVPVEREPLYKATGYAQVVVQNGEIVSHDVSGYHGNRDAMPMTNELVRYNYGQYEEEAVIPVQDGGYDPRMHHSDGYYGNMNMSAPSDQMPQGLNILTVAMNMVNPGSY